MLSTSRPRRVRAVLLGALALVAGATCRDAQPTGPGVPVRSRVAVAPRFQSAALAGGPQLRLAKVRARLWGWPTDADTISQDVAYTGDSAVVQFDVTLFGASRLYGVRLDGIDASGDTLFLAEDSVRAFPGTERRPASLSFRYVGPDANVTSIGMVPGDTILDAPDSLRLHAIAVGVAQQPRLRLGWTSRDPVVLPVSDSGTVRPRSIERSVWVVAQLWNGVKDSALVRVRAPVASLVIARDTATLVRGDTLRLTTTLADSIGTLLAGRTVLWQAIDTTVTVDSTGLVTARLARTTGRVVARVGTRADTAMITVLPRPVALVDATPDTVALVEGATAQLSVAVKDAQGALNPDWTPAWSAADTAIASVSATGLVAAKAAGRTIVRVVAGGVRDSVSVTVASSAPVITTTRVTPQLDTLPSLGDTVKLVASAFIGTTPAAGAFTWANRAPSIVSLDSAGRVVALANGSAWIVATEAGGTRDSALVVVQQRVSTVSLTPNTVSRYLGTTQQFAATAVDARGNGMPSARFTWSSTASGVVTVDTTGLAQMVGIGTATVRATAGGIAGQADVTVRSAITRIVVAPDSVVLNAFGMKRIYSAVAYDTVGAPMTGIAFAFSSSNPSVGLMRGDTVTSTANGTTRIRATAQGVTGEALLTVQQALAAIEVLPSSPKIAPGGTVVLTARGRDPNGYYVSSNPTFSWTSSATPTATVDGSGVVTAPANAVQGNAVITASAGQVTGSATVTVSNTGVPLSLSFGHDTIGIGRGTTISVPLYLSVPSGQAPVTVKLASSDTMAYFPVDTAVFAPGVTAINVSLAARNAGTVTVTATDVGGGGYTAASAIVAVQANVRFNTTSTAMVATDQRAFKVLLSDPAPAGGAYVTFGATVAGIAQISPDPVFIDAGLLSADVVVRGVTPGTTRLSLSAAGITGANTLDVTVSAAALKLYYGNTILGSGQYEPSGNFIYIPQALSYPLTVTMTSSDTTIARTDPQVTIPAGQSYAYFSMRAFENRTGTVTYSVSAPGWTGDSRQIVATTPVITLCCNISTNTTSGATALSAYVRDSVGNTHYRINSLAVRFRSRDTLVAVVDSTATIPANASSVGGIAVRPRGGGTTWIVAAAGGHVTGDSVQVTVAAPQLAIYYGTTMLGAGQYEQNANFVYIPNAIATPVTVSFSVSDTTIARPIGPVIIPAGQTYAYYRIEGYKPGTVTYTASAAGYGTASRGITVTSPRLSACCTTTQPMYAPPVGLTAYARDSVGNGHPLLTPITITWTSSDTTVARVDADTSTIAAGSSYTNARTAAIRAPGTAILRLTTPASAAYAWAPDSITIKVDSADLRVYYGPQLTAKGHQVVNGNFVYIPHARTDTVVVTVTQRRTGIVTLPASIRIPAGQTYAYFSWDGLAVGADTASFSAPGYRGPAVLAFPVSRRLIQVGGIPGALASTAPPFTFSLATRDTVGNVRPVSDTVTLRVTSSDTTVLQLDSTWVHIVRGQAYHNTTRARIVGVGSARIRVQDSTGVMPADSTNLLTVTGPLLHIYYQGTTVGMHQRARNVNFVYTDNAVASPLTVSLASSSTRVLQVQSVTIPAGQTYAYFDVVGGDSVGLVRVTATATGYQLATTDVDVGQPRLRVSTNASVTTTTPKQSLTVQLLDQAGNGREAVDSFAITLSSTAPGVAAVDSATIHFVPGQSQIGTPTVHYLSAGTARIVATDPRTALWRLTPDSATVTVVQPTVAIYYGNISLAPGQYVDNFVYIPNALPDTLKVALAHDAAKTSVPDTVRINPGSTYQYFRVTGISSAAGADTIRVSAPGHQGSTNVVGTGQGRVQLNGWPGTLAVGDSVQLTLYSLDPQGNGRPVAAATTFTLAPNANVVFHDAQGATVTQVTIPANGSSIAGFWVKAVATGTASVTISASGYQNGVFNTAVP